MAFLIVSVNRRHSSLFLIVISVAILGCHRRQENLKHLIDFNMRNFYETFKPSTIQKQTNIE